MSTGSSIEWTEATWNPVVGCTRVSAGCDNRLSPSDPALVALNKMAEVLAPFDRAAQLRIIAQVCVGIGEYGYAQEFIAMLAQEARHD